MNTKATFSIKSANSRVTERLGERLGKNLKGGETIELIGDLGGGKTTFTKGLVRGAGGADDVTSPSFVLSKVYQTPKFTVRHFDFYRLSEPGIVAQELEESIQSREDIVVIEWGESVRGALPKDRLIIKFSHIKQDIRHIEIFCPLSKKYLLKDIKNVNFDN